MFIDLILCDVETNQILQRIYLKAVWIVHKAFVVISGSFFKTKMFIFCGRISEYLWKNTKISVCVYPFSHEGGINLFGDQRGSIILNRAETVRKDSSDANLKRFQHNILYDRRNPTFNMGEFKVWKKLSSLIWFLNDL